MKKLIYLVVISLMFVGCEKNEVEVLEKKQEPKVKSIRFVMDLVINGSIYYAGISNGNDSVTNDINITNVGTYFKNVSKGDTSKWIKVEWTKVRLHITDANIWYYRTSVYNVTDSMTIRVTKMSRYK